MGDIAVELRERLRHKRRADQLAAARKSVATILAENAARERLAHERQKCWRRMSSLISEDGLISSRTAREHSRLVERVEWITASLNGHAHDTTGHKSYTEDSGGRYEQKRIDRMQLGLKLEGFCW